MKYYLISYLTQDLWRIWIKNIFLPSDTSLEIQDRLGNMVQLDLPCLSKTVACNLEQCLSEAVKMRGHVRDNSGSVNLRTNVKKVLYCNSVFFFIYTGLY